MKVIRVEKLSKKYRIGEAQSQYRTLRDSLTSKFRRRKASPDNEIWALKDISFEVEQGEVVGIIGRNGAGKSTLLKVLAHITRPTEGRVTLHGRVGSLLEVGTGFHPELTGRENIYLNGAVLGMRRKEIERKFDEIVDFAEIEKFLDTPVKHYSSGMYMRLAFAVAAHLEPEILLVDEVLAVGDVAFQKKCLGKMGEVAQQGRTVLFVSHNMAAVEQLCSRGIMLKAGKMDYQGSARDATRLYLQETVSHGVMDIDSDFYREGDGRVRISRLEIVDPQTDTRVAHIGAGEDFIVRFTLQAKEPVQYPRIGFALLTSGRVRVFNTVTNDSDLELPIIQGEYTAELYISGIVFAPGNYLCNLAVSDRNGNYCDYLRELPCFEVDYSSALPPNRDYNQNSGIVFPKISWQVEVVKI